MGNACPTCGDGSMLCCRPNLEPLALARVAGVPLWRRALAWLRCLRLRRQFASQVDSQDAINERQANATRIAAAYDAAARSLARDGYVRPPPTSMPSDGVSSPR